MRPSIDWEAVERDYRTGSFTDRELGIKHGCSHTAVQKHAREGGWAKDLAGAVKAATESKLLEAEVAKGASAEVAARVARQVAKELPAATEVVSAMATVNSEVILRHRADAREARNVAMGLLAELSAVSRNGEAIEELIARASEDLDDDQAASMRSQLHELMRLHSRVGSMHRLADTLAKLQALERKAFKLDDEAPADPSKARVLTDVERAAKLASVLERARKAREAAARPTLQ